MDISLHPIGYKNFNDKNCNLILSKLKDNSGSLALHDKSTPEEIYEILGISKKAFKKALGALYKAKEVEIGEEFIKLL
jgi:predicted RNA-binding protein (virulence factor B family)